MRFCDDESFRAHMLEAPLFIPSDLLERVQEYWLDDGVDGAMGDGWAHTESVVIDEGLAWINEFETDEIAEVKEVPVSLSLKSDNKGLFEGDLRRVAPGLARGYEFESFGDKPNITSIETIVKTEELVESFECNQEDGLVEGVDSITIDRETGFKFVRPSKGKKSDNTTSWARPVDSHHIPEDFGDVVPRMAMEYPFELDPFQKQAVYHLEKSESVFVAAHTSAGKTVVAEYAIALARKHLTRTIYTSPIKALSNQKFRDFKEQFGDVGLLTGDVQLNPDAHCMIMTTEILRSMLYRGADMLADVEFVIFDEVHYVNDAERGVVWEEVIIMLPAHVTIIMLSATIPNTAEFADWVGRTKQKPIYVISTLQRPVPLEHFLYVPRREMIKIVDAGRNFLEAGYKSLLLGDKTAIGGKSTTSGKSIGPASFGRDKSMWSEMTYMLKKKSLLPAVIFTFSKKRCEEYADSLSGMDLSSAGEKSAVHLFLEQTVLRRLKGTDSQLPQIQRMAELLGRGIGVHHSGLLPIMKEAVEMLFGRGLVKVLFATETFAMGVNMPARSVVFSSLRKHDGNGFRTLLPGEYTQMAGRAGRRGLDPTGVVIITCPSVDDPPSESTLRTTILGLPTRLTSQFRLTHHMILSLLRVQALRMEQMIRSSFSEAANQRALPSEEAEAAEHEAVLEGMERVECAICEGDLGEYYGACQAVLQAGAVVYDWLLNESKQASRYLVPGRIIIVNTAFHRNTPAAVLNIQQSDSTGGKSLTVLALNRNGSTHLADCPYPPDYVDLSTDDTLQSQSPYTILSILPPEIVKITKERVQVPFDSFAGSLHPRDLADLAGRLVEFIRSGPSLGDELELPAAKSLEVDEKRLLKRAILSTLPAHQCSHCPDLLTHYQHHHQRQLLSDKLAALRFRISDSSMLLLPEYQARVRVLKALEYIDPVSSVVLLKGRVAGEICTTDELITTELLFSNTFADMEPAEIIALLSSMVFQERHAAPPLLHGRLLQGQEKIIETAKNLVTIQREHGVDIAMDQVIGGLHFGLVQVVYEWACGKPFKQITELTDVLEGSIVRCIVRLDETCRELRSAAKIMGDPTLHRKMEEASNLIKRDICFASSLYI